MYGIPPVYLCVIPQPSTLLSQIYVQQSRSYFVFDKGCHCVTPDYIFARDKAHRMFLHMSDRLCVGYTTLGVCLCALCTLEKNLTHIFSFYTPFGNFVFMHVPYKNALRWRFKLSVFKSNHAHSPGHTPGVSLIAFQTYDGTHLDSEVNMCITNLFVNMCCLETFKNRFTDWYINYFMGSFMNWFTNRFIYLLELCVHPDRCQRSI